MQNEIKEDRSSIGEDADLRHDFSQQWICLQCLGMWHQSLINTQSQLIAVLASKTIT